MKKMPLINADDREVTITHLVTRARPVLISNSNDSVIPSGFYSYGGLTTNGDDPMIGNIAGVADSGLAWIGNQCRRLSNKVWQKG